MKKSKIETRVTLVTLLTIFLVILTFVWILSAIQVDLNGLAYRAEVNQAADLRVGLGNHGDDEQASRIRMQSSSFWALRLAANLPFLGRLAITAGFILLTYLALRCLVSMLLTLQEQQRRHKKR